MDAIVLKNLTKSYGRSRGIIDVNLIVKEHEFFGFIGPNGAGKSTTIRTILGLIKQNSGTAQVFGLDSTDNHLEMLKAIGYLPSEAKFYPGMKCLDVIKLSLGLRGIKDLTEALNLASRLNLDTNMLVDSMSFGNKKKVGIVCALAHFPKLIILDEPTSGLDPLMQKEFFDILRERNQAGATIFLSSHILSEIERNCLRAAIIKEGRIIACDNVKELAKSNARRVTVRGDIKLDLLPEIKDVTKTNDSISFLYQGDINLLINALAKNNLTDLTITESDLEEVFRHYYEKEEK